VGTRVAAEFPALRAKVTLITLISIKKRFHWVGDE
jgi:hypothetical protein